MGPSLAPLVLAHLKDFDFSQSKTRYFSSGHSRANDGLRGVKTETTYENLKKVIQLATDNKIKVLLCGVRVPPNYGEEYAKKFVAIFAKLQKDFNLTFVPRILEGVAGASLNQADGIHPNEKGHEIMAHTVYLKLKDLL